MSNIEVEGSGTEELFLSHFITKFSNQEGFQVCIGTWPNSFKSSNDKSVNFYQKYFVF